MSFLGFKIWRVDGDSMSPAIPKNSYVLVNHWFNFFGFRQESVVLIKHHFYGLIIKKIAIIDRNGLIWSRGENEQSLPIEQLGPVNKNQIMGNVLMVFKPSKAH